MQPKKRLFVKEVERLENTSITTTLGGIVMNALGAPLLDRGLDKES